MKFINKKLILFGFMAFPAMAAAYAAAHNGGPTLLESINTGMWQFRAVGGGPTGTAVNRLCVGNPKKLAQIQHASANCEQFIVRSTPKILEISYSCSGQGQGNSWIRKEANNILHIQSRGISRGAPFSFAIEARQSGGC